MAEAILVSIIRSICNLVSISYSTVLCYTALLLQNIDHCSLSRITRCIRIGINYHPIYMHCSSDVI